MRIVKNGDVHVSVPIGMSKKEAEAFIEQHREWIVEARKKTVERQKQRTAFYSQLPLATQAQKEEALLRLKALVEPMVERRAKEISVRQSYMAATSVALRQKTANGCDWAQADIYVGRRPPCPGSATDGCEHLL